MTSFDDILKSVQLSQNTQELLGLASRFSKISKAQERISRSLSGINMIAEIAKNMQRQKMFANPALLAVEELTKSMNHHSKFAIPQTTLDAISSIDKHHEQLFGNLRSIIETFDKHQATFSQINNLTFAIEGISTQLAAIASSQRKWDLIGDYEKITEKSVSLNERIFDENGVTKEGLIELKEFFQRIEIKINKIDADANAVFWKVLIILSFILSAISEGRNWLPKPEYATKQEVETVIKNQFIFFESKLKAEKKYRITNRKCKVLLKPKMKSLVIEKLPADFEVIILQINHKWVYVSYLNPKDNLPETGWILKKYVDKPQKKSLK